MFGIGLGELILILIVGLVLFGAEGLQEVAKVAGKLLKEFRKIQASVQETLDEVDLESTKKPADKKVETESATEFKTDSKTESKAATVSTYQPQTQESVRAELEKIAGKNFSVNTEEKSDAVENISATHSDNISETRSENISEISSETISKISLEKKEA